MNFNSQICTTREQSERLIALGLKKETADMALHFSYMDMYGNAYYIPYTIGHQCNGIPAWSLHRLIEMMPEYIVLSGQGHYISIREHCVKYVLDGYESNYMGVWSGYTLYDKLINCIEWLIEEGYFNKEYLEE